MRMDITNLRRDYEGEPPKSDRTNKRESQRNCWIKNTAGNAGRQCKKVEGGTTLLASTDRKNMDISTNSVMLIEDAQLSSVPSVLTTPFSATEAPDWQPESPKNRKSVVPRSSYIPKRTSSTVGVPKTPGFELENRNEPVADIGLRGIVSVFTECHRLQHLKLWSTTACVSIRPCRAA